MITHLILTENLSSDYNYDNLVQYITLISQTNEKMWLFNTFQISSSSEGSPSR